MDLDWHQAGVDAAVFGFRGARGFLTRGSVLLTLVFFTLTTGSSAVVVSNAGPSGGVAYAV